MDKRAKEEVTRIKNILVEAEISEKRIKMLMPVIENTAFMKIKLDDTVEVIKDSQIAISYDNGGGQKGIRENPLLKGYESLWKSYMAGMNVILSALPPEKVKEEEQKVVETKTMLELVRGKHKKQA